MVYYKDLSICKLNEKIKKTFLCLSGMKTSDLLDINVYLLLWQYWSQKIIFVVQQWIDKIRTPRASNEARLRLFTKLSGTSVKM